MKTGDTVKVHQHGSPERSSEAKVLLLSENERSIALHFADKPAFVVDKSGGMAIHRDNGYLVMLATRSELHGKPWGPWIEIFGGGHFEIEEVAGAGD